MGLGKRISFDIGDSNISSIKFYYNRNMYYISTDIEERVAVLITSTHVEIFVNVVNVFNSIFKLDVRSIKFK